MILKDYLTQDGWHGLHSDIKKEEYRQNCESLEHILDAFWEQFLSRQSVELNLLGIDRNSLLATGAGHYSW